MLKASMFIVMVTAPSSQLCSPRDAGTKAASCLSGFQSQTWETGRQHRALRTGLGGVLRGCGGARAWRWLFFSATQAPPPSPLLPLQALSPQGQPGSPPGAYRPLGLGLRIGHM